MTTTTPPVAAILHELTTGPGWRDEPPDMILAAAKYYANHYTLDDLRADPTITPEQAEKIIRLR